ncbi:restriction endonuclease [Clostridium botulinum]|nr:restriction endonuclease [Clostridium botulinum]MBY6934388.1 type I restriction enzyme HsdR N-terminal domain-containing protein [Clostridium botulinum]NFL83353.1 type I restriction enzyme HsdR N-terminal domain-containing protein [Clostridium botulinum]NFN12201.1 type I restriction enzyme HsdR N-terminal domain-containing protein [Clostridium botulinum]NFO37632.1 type I restriction enzyme HsdR N-terminal domain-containing protein [Clostridium botulinum]
MNKKARFNVLNDFNYEVLDDPEFREDSVREEIIYPIIKALAYSSYGNNKIIRSRKLLHPFVSIGSKQKKINIIPDYVMEIDGKPSWIMEAKSPDQDILNTKHVEQAYSYAMHSEIKALYYALCNGKEFVLYHVSEYKPLLHFKIQLLPYYWGELVELLSPENFTKNSARNLYKDLGLHLKRLGFDVVKGLIFPYVPMSFIAKLNDNLYTFGTNIKQDEDTYCVSFDFNHEVFLQLQGKIPDEVLMILKNSLDGEIKQVKFADTLFYVDIECDLSGKIEENSEEIFLPLIIKRII